MPWAQLLGLGLAGLGWRPADFWQATPQELAAALAFLDERQRGLGGAEIETLKEWMTHGTRPTDRAD